MAGHDDMVTISVPVPPRVLVLGHSFVARLGQAASSDPVLSPDLNLRNVRVRCVGFRGGNIYSLIDDDTRRLHRELMHYPPTLVILQIGGNDIDSPQFDEDQYKKGVSHFIFGLQTLYFVEKVAVCEIFPRLETRNVFVDQYQEIKDRINRDSMVQYSVQQPLNDVIFWYHRVGIATTANYFSKYRVHLNTRGTHKLYHSIRRIINFCCPE